MEGAQENSVKKHQAQQLSFNSLQVVLSVGMVAVGASVGNLKTVESFDNLPTNYINISI